MLGPTYLYSFTAVVGTADLDLAGEDHPPTRQRIRMMLDQLAEADWTPVLETASREVHDWHLSVAATSHVYQDLEERFCVDALTRLAPQIRAIVGHHVGELAFAATEFVAVREEIDKYLDLGIPPSQTLRRTAIDRVSIILGSWIYAIRRQGGDVAALARSRHP